MQGLVFSFCTGFELWIGLLDITQTAGVGLETLMIWQTRLVCGMDMLIVILTQEDQVVAFRRVSSKYLRRMYEYKNTQYSVLRHRDHR